MPRMCDLTGKSIRTGHNVSHANNRTKRTFAPNLQHKTLVSEILGERISLRLSTSAIRTIDKHHGFDNYMLTVKNVRSQSFSVKALRVMKNIRKAANAKGIAGEVISV